MRASALSCALRTWVLNTGFCRVVFLASRCLSHSKHRDDESTASYCWNILSYNIESFSLMCFAEDCSLIHYLDRHRRTSKERKDFPAEILCCNECSLICAEQDMIRRF